jgi:hypothetical protein
MNQTITQSGALFELQERRARRERSNRRKVSSQPDGPIEPRKSLRTSAGEFAFRLVPSGCRLELIVGAVRRVLGEYETDEAAIQAVRLGHTGCHTWDSLERSAAARQLADPKRQRV